jgi:hypothetical protein
VSTSKRCKHCGEQKPIEEYYRDRAAADGRRPECKSCSSARRKAWYATHREDEIARVKQWQQQNSEWLNAYRREHNATPQRKRAMRDRYYRRTFGLSADQVDEMIESQGGGCAICGRRPKRLASLHVDHCHEEGTVRGILCLGCNQGLGQFQHDPKLLRRAAAYMRAGGR